MHCNILPVTHPLSLLVLDSLLMRTVKLPVLPFSFNQLVVCATLYNPPTIYNIYNVCIFYSRQPVGNDQCCTAFGYSVDRPLDNLFRNIIQRACRFIQY